MEKPDWVRFARWIISNIILAFIPLCSVWFFRSLFKKDAIEATSDYPEIIFIAIIVCVTAFGDIVSRKNRESWKLVYVLFEGSLLIGILGSAILYGGLRIVNVTVPVNTQDTTNLVNSLNPPSLMSAVIFTICFALIGIISEVLITYSEVSPIERTEQINEQSNS